MKLKSVIKTIVFLAILSAALLTINAVLMPNYYLKNSKWPTTSSYNAFYEMNRNSIDVLFFGSSVCVNQFSPMEIYNRNGIRCFNLGSEQQSVFLSYYWLKEALRFQKPSVVILEGRFLRTHHPENAVNTVEGLIRKCLDPMRWSSVKLEAVRDLCSRDGENIESYFFTNIRFHDRWKYLEEIDFTFDAESARSQLMGWAPGTGGNAKSFTPFSPSDKDQTFKLDPVMVEYFVKMAKLCKENDIEFVLVDVPAETNAAMHYALKKLTSENEVDYIEMSEESTWSELAINMPFESPIVHGNIWGNIKISQYIGKVLSERYGVPSVADDQFEEKKKFYQHIVNCAKLRITTDIDEYLSLLQGDDYFYIYIAVSDEAARNMRETTKAHLKELGFAHEWDPETDLRKSYIGVKNDEGIIEKSGGRIEVSGQDREKRDTYSIISSGYLDEGGPCASIIINGKQYAVNNRGLNIVVYDTTRLSVTDSVCFDTCFESDIRRKEEG